jgi:hypothetical protein
MKAHVFQHLPFEGLGSIGGRRSYPELSAVSPQRKGGFVGQWKYLVSCPPHDSERMSFRLGCETLEITTESLDGCGEDPS